MLDDEVLIQHLKKLSSDDFLGRQFATKGSLKAQIYLVEKLKESHVLPFQGHYYHDFDYNKSLGKNKSGSNIIGFIKGSEFPESYIVLSAHFDHLGQKKHQVFNGADDNASGTAALLHFAQKLTHYSLRHSLIVLFTDGEEVNLLGAKAFVKEQEQLLDSIKLNINLDMIGGSKQTKKLRFISDNIESILTEEKRSMLKALQANLSLKQKKGFKRNNKSTAMRTNWKEASDHSVFYHLDIPFIYFGVDTHRNYHTINDTFENINNAFFVNASEAIFKQIIYLDQNMSSNK